MEKFRKGRGLMAIFKEGVVGVVVLVFLMHWRCIGLRLLKFEEREGVCGILVCGLVG